MNYWLVGWVGDQSLVSFEMIFNDEGWERRRKEGLEEEEEIDRIF